MKNKKQPESNYPEILILGHCLIGDVYHYKVIGLHDNPEETFIPAREVPSHSSIAAYWRAFSFERQVSQSAKIEDVIRQNKDEKEPEGPPLWPKEDEIQIFGILKNENPLKLAVQLPNSQDISIVPSSYLKKKFPTQLSLFYEKNIRFDTTNTTNNT